MVVPLSGYYTIEFSYVPQARSSEHPDTSTTATAGTDQQAATAGDGNKCPVFDEDLSSQSDTGSSSADEKALQMLDSQSLAQRVKKREKKLRKAQGDMEHQKKSNLQKASERVEKAEERVRKCQALLDAAEKRAAATAFSDWCMTSYLSFEGGDVSGSIRGHAIQHNKPVTAIAMGASGPTAGAGGPSSTGIVSAPESNQEEKQAVPAGSSLLNALAEEVKAQQQEAQQHQHEQEQQQASGAASSSLHASSSLTTAPNGLPPVYVLEDSTWRISERKTVDIELRLFVTKLKGAVFGSDTDLKDLSLKLECEFEDLGWCVGEVEGSSQQCGFSLKKDGRVRFVLRRFTGPRCVCCGTFISEVVSYGCSCQAVEYCSAACQQKHSATHRAYCSALAPYGYGRVGKYCIPEPPYNQGALLGHSREYFLWWRETTCPYTFSIFVDHRNPLGVAYEINVNLLVDAMYGLDMDFFAQVEASEEDLLKVNLQVFQAIYHSALLEGNAPLAAIALNFLYRWFDNRFLLARYYRAVFQHFFGGSSRSIIAINSLHEYVLTARPRFEMANVALEAALNSSTPSDFWYRLDYAKGAVVESWDFTFGSKAQNIRTILVPEHQRQVLHLRARIYIMMASRQPVDVATKLLEQAVQCYKDAVEDDKARNDLYNMGMSCLNLSLVYRMFPEQEDQELANPMKIYALELLRKGEGKTPAERAPQVIKQALSALVAAAKDSGKGGEAVAAAGAGTNTTAAAAAAGKPASNPPNTEESAEKKMDGKEQ